MLIRITGKWLFVSVVLVGLVAGGILYARTGHQYNKSLMKRSLADVRTLVHSLEDYRADRGEYPIGFGAEFLQPAISKHYKRPPNFSMSYFSDGENYALLLRPWIRAGEEGPIPVGHVAAFEVVNGKLVNWPDWLDVQSVELIRIRALEITGPNLDLPIDEP